MLCAITAQTGRSGGKQRRRNMSVSYTHLDVYKRQVHECCNYIDGNCIALDDGEECVCVQSISYSLLCRWFRAAVLPQDKELETALFHRLNAKKCSVCKALFTPGSNRAKYCPECAARMKRVNAAKRKRKQREKCHALGAEKPL